MVRHARACPRFSIITKQQCLWEELSYLLHEFTHPWKLHRYHVVLVGFGPACLRFSVTTNHQYFWKGLSDFVDFLQVICILLDIHWSYKNILVWLGTVRHSHSANEIFRCFKLQKPKTIWSMNMCMSLCFHWS